MARTKNKFTAAEIVPVPLADVRTVELEVAELKADLIRLQAEARSAGDWRKEISVIDRRLKLIEVRLRETRDHSVNFLNVNVDVDDQTAAAMATAYLARRHEKKLNGSGSSE